MNFDNLEIIMKKTLLILFCGVLLCTACSKIYDESEIIKTAWDYIPDESKETVIHPWNEGWIMNTKSNKNYYYDGTSCWLVVFNTTDDDLLGPICVYVSKKRQKALGIGLRY